jgi:CubicO group peptidase (beta-lactamase class C family)
MACDNSIIRNPNNGALLAGTRCMKFKSSLLAFGLLFLCCSKFLLCATGRSSPLPATDGCVVPGSKWVQASPVEQAEWSSEKLALARQYSNSLHSSSVLIVQNGHVIDEWGDTTKKITSFSVRKSLLSSLYGIYSKRGVIDINQTLAQAGIDDAPDPLTKKERAARIVDLLRARSGVYHPVDFETRYQQKTRPARGSHPPGTFWFYNNWDFNALGTIFEKKTGLTIGRAFYERIAQPIGMQDFKPNDVYYLSGPVSIHKAYMFEMSGRDMARFGQLYLCGGRWKNRQIVPADWVQKSTHATEAVNKDASASGYEYLWWVEFGGVLIPEATLPGMYSAQGAGGHYILVVPSLNLVIVHRFDNEPSSKDVQGVLDAAQGHGIFDDEFGRLVRLILDAHVSRNSQS